MDREEWKIKFEEWWANYCLERNNNGVAIGCKVDPNDLSPDAERRYVE